MHGIGSCFPAFLIHTTPLPSLREAGGPCFSGTREAVRYKKNARPDGSRTRAGM